MPVLDENQTALLDSLRHQMLTGSITQIQVAQATGIHQSQISRILAGHIRRQSKNVLKLCKYAETAGVKPQRSIDLDSQLAPIIQQLAINHPSEAMALEKVISSLVEWRQTWRATQ